MTQGPYHEPLGDQGAPAVHRAITEHGGLRVDGSNMTEAQLASWHRMTRVVLRMAYSNRIELRGDVLVPEGTEVVPADVPSISPVWLSIYEK